MANQRTLSRPYNGGEMTPEFLAKLDDTKFQTGLARYRNFIVKPHAGSQVQLNQRALV